MTHRQDVEQGIGFFRVGVGALMALLAASLLVAFALHYAGGFPLRHQACSPLQVALFLFGQTGAPFLLALLCIVAFDLFNTQAKPSRALWRLVGGTALLMAITALAGLPYTDDPRGQAAFAQGGLAGYLLVNYYGLALPYHMGTAGAGALFAAGALAGSMIGSSRGRRAIATWLLGLSDTADSGLRSQRRAARPERLGWESAPSPQIAPNVTGPQAPSPRPHAQAPEPQHAATAAPTRPDAPTPAASPSLLGRLLGRSVATRETSVAAYLQANPAQARRPARVVGEKDVERWMPDLRFGQRGATSVAASSAEPASAPQKVGPSAGRGATPPARPIVSETERPAPAATAPASGAHAAANEDSDWGIEQDFDLPPIAAASDPVVDHDAPVPLFVAPAPVAAPMATAPERTQAVRPSAPAPAAPQAQPAPPEILRPRLHTIGEPTQGASTGLRVLAVNASAEGATITPEDVSAAETPEGWVEEFPPDQWFEGWEPPPLGLLNPPEEATDLPGDDELVAQARLLQKTLNDFGIQARLGVVTQGPVVTLFELHLSAGTKVARLTSIENDIAMALAAPSVRILAPIPGKTSVGIEIPNANPQKVVLRQILSASDFWRDPSPLLFALGSTIDDQPRFHDLARMPHLLIAGATNSGKSVTLNAIISSILFHMSPSIVRMLLIDPKRVELSIYGDIPHLIAPVISEPNEAAEALRWVVDIMEERCRRLQAMRVRNIQKYNEIARGERRTPRMGQARPPFLPYLVVIIDELADLMLVNRGEIETSLVRLAQKARAVGIHLIVATQRPSVDVITGLIRANFPSRIAFQVTSKVDSRIIIDYNGAECLLGRGDMLFSPGGAAKPERLQGAYISEDEVEALVEFLRARSKPWYLREDFIPADKAGAPPASPASPEPADSGAINDELYYNAIRAVMDTGQATQSALTSRLNIGRTNAGRLLDRMEREGLIERRGRMREVRIDLTRLEQAGTPGASPLPGQQQRLSG